MACNSSGQDPTGKGSSGGVLSGRGLADGGQPEATDGLSETENKLRRKVGALEQRLEERGAELLAAKEETGTARDLLARYVYFTGLDI